MLLDARGKPIEKKMVQAHLIIFVSKDDGSTWSPTIDIPDWVRDPDVLGNMVEGDMCSNPEHGPEWYRAEKVTAH